jgi:hypothetical protein
MRSFAIVNYRIYRPLAGKGAVNMERFFNPAERAAFQHQKIINSGRCVEPLGSGFLMSVFQPTMMTNIVDCDLYASSPRTAGLPVPMFAPA